MAVGVVHGSVGGGPGDGCVNLDCCAVVKFEEVVGGSWPETLVALPAASGKKTGELVGGGREEVVVAGVGVLVLEGMGEVGLEKVSGVDGVDLD